MFFKHPPLSSKLESTTKGVPWLWLGPSGPFCLRYHPATPPPKAKIAGSSEGSHPCLPLASPEVGWEGARSADDRPSSQGRPSWSTPCALLCPQFVPLCPVALRRSLSVCMDRVSHVAARCTIGRSPWFINRFPVGDVGTWLFLTFCHSQGWIRVGVPWAEALEWSRGLEGFVHCKECGCCLVTSKELILAPLPLSARVPTPWLHFGLLSSW